MNAWPLKKLGDICESVDYGHTASSTPLPVGPKFLRITDIQDGQVNWETVPFCICEPSDEAQAKLQPGDIVFARTGATTGKSFLLIECPDSAIFASYLIRVRPSHCVSSAYLAHFFQSTDYWRQIISSARGAAQPGVNATVLKGLTVPIPPLPEQRRIAAILDQAEALRTKRRQALAKLDTLTQSLFLEMFGDPDTANVNWPIQKVGQLCWVRGGKRLPKASAYSDSPTPYRYVRVTDFMSGEISANDLWFLTEEVQRKIARYTVHAGDVIISIAGSIGHIAEVPDAISGSNLTENAAKLVAKMPNVYTPTFLASVLRSRFVQSQISSRIGQVTIGKLALFRIEQLLVPLPPIELQQKFAKTTVRIKSEVAKSKAIQSATSYLFVSLQHRAFHGEL